MSFIFTQYSFCNSFIHGLLCILGWLLQDYAGRSYHVFLPQVVCQKRNPHIDGWFSICTAHIGPGKNSILYLKIVDIGFVLIWYYIFLLTGYVFVLTGYCICLKIYITFFKAGYCICCNLLWYFSSMYFVFVSTR